MNRTVHAYNYSHKKSCMRDTHLVSRPTWNFEGKNKIMAVTLGSSSSSGLNNMQGSTGNQMGNKQACGPLRNLTSLYSKYRTDHKSKRSRFGYSLLGEGNEALRLGRKRIDIETGEDYLLASSAGGEAGSVEMVSQSVPSWVVIADKVKDSILQAKEKLVTLSKLQQKRLLRVFDDEGSKGDHEVESVSSSITNLLYQGERGIKEIERLPVDNRDMIVNIQKSLATQLTVVSQEFRGMQKKYMSEIQRRRVGSGEFVSASSSMDNILDAAFTEDQLIELEGIESHVETRSVEISKIAKSITELNLVFKDLANLVVEQGTILDRIDYNIENVQTATREANKELLKAEETQKSSRIQKCILALVAFIVLNILILTARS